MTAIVTIEHKGGAGSGHHGHAGIPGKQGGSLPGTGTPRIATEAQNNARRAASIRKRIMAGDYNPGKRKGKAPPLYDSYHNYQTDVRADDVLNNTHDLRAMQPYDDPTWHGAYSETRGKVKNAIVTQLSEDTGLPYDDVNSQIAKWAGTSNDDDIYALNMQKNAAEEFGLELSEWQQNKLTTSGYMVTGGLANSEQKLFIRTMYANTQANFAMQGFKATDTITLYRGFKVPSLTAKEDLINSRTMAANLGKEINWSGNAMESWTSSKSVAANFGNNIIAMEVPISNIIGTCVTGFGCLTEAEYVVAGSTDSKARLIRAVGYNHGEKLPDWIFGE